MTDYRDVPALHLCRLFVLALLLVASPGQLSAQESMSDRRERAQEALDAANAELEIARIQDSTRDALKEAARVRRGREDIPVQIEYASYGAENNTCDASAYVAIQCEGKPNCSFTVGDSMCGNPAISMKRKLHVTYTCDDVSKEANADRATMIYLFCSPANGGQ